LTLKVAIFICNCRDAGNHHRISAPGKSSHRTKHRNTYTAYLASRQVTLLDPNNILDMPHCIHQEMLSSHKPNFSGQCSIRSCLMMSAAFLASGPITINFPFSSAYLMCSPMTNQQRCLCL